MEQERKRIKNKMKELKISAYQLSKDTGINQSNLSRFFNGADLYLSNYLKILEYLGIPRPKG
jgi:transcriptional regulator with XRE-family HTH domain